MVRVSDGAELGQAVHEYADGVVDAPLPGTAITAAGRLGAAEPGGLGRGAAQGRRRPRSLRSGVDPADIVAHRHRLHRVHRLADRPPTARRCASCPELRDRPHAWPKLWRHHAAQAQADRINALAHERGESVDRPLRRQDLVRMAVRQGARNCSRTTPRSTRVTERWIEAADWIVWQLAGRETRNACTAGYKGIYQDGHYPSRDFLAALNPGFADFAATSWSIRCRRTRRRRPAR